MGILIMVLIWLFYTGRGFRESTGILVVSSVNAGDNASYVLLAENSKWSYAERLI